MFLVMLKINLLHVLAKRTYFLLLKNLSVIVELVDMKLFYSFGKQISHIYVFIDALHSIRNVLTQSRFTTFPQAWRSYGKKNMAVCFLPAFLQSAPVTTS